MTDFSFIDEIFEDLLFSGHDDEHKAIKDSKQSLIKNFEKLMLEVIKQSKNPHDYDKWAEHIRTGYDWAIREVEGNLESMLSKLRSTD